MGTWEVVAPGDLQRQHDEWHLAPAVRVGDLLICSGVTGMDARYQVDPDPTEQFRTVFRNAQHVLAGAGLTLADVAEMVTFHVDLAEHLDTFSAVRDEFITGPYPAWTAVEVAGLGGGVPGVLVEVKMTAAF
ncbi:Rid family hydrolase [Rhodococcus sp. HNM0569]|uniref:Rid family hydrolase n=1 Tax=Rhodococcus sp. HNM0569 TaxID=2716340 RepID=UPI00146E56B3|nr:Rid family hydrolase [Rhodococcus sp. HNM0569]NLU82727.1 RidA family protein [Rhodococcus sp. HNM0569]